MSFARSAARLLRAVPTAAAPASHLPFHTPFASSSRLLSTFRPTPLLSSPFASNGAKAGSAGIAAFLPKRFPSGSGATSGSRGVATLVKRADEVDWTKIGTSVGVALVAVVGLNYALNRETRGALTAAESSYLNDTFRWTGAGLAITGVTAKLLHSSGVAARMMQANPWVFMGVGLVASIGSMMGVYNTAPGTPAHVACWAVFTAVQGVTLSPMFFLNPAILSRAGLYTVGALGGLCYVGATAHSEQFLYIGGPLLAGLGVVLVSSLVPMLLPRMATRTMSILEHVSAYGGVAVFSGFILYDTQKILRHSKMVEAGVMQRDPIRESVSLILDAINLFVRIVQVMMLQQRKK